MLELLKLMVQPVVLERDPAGAIVRELPGETASLYTLDDIARFVQAARAELGRINDQNGGPTMPMETVQVVHIVCDNPTCPGNTLDPADRAGWIFVTSEVYGEPTNPPNVYCSPECAGSITLVLNPPVELPPPDPGL